MSVPVTNDQYNAASQVVANYAGQDISQLTQEQKNDLANNLAVMARYRDSQSVNGDTSKVLDALNQLPGGSKLTIGTFFELMSGKPGLVPPDVASQAVNSDVIAWFNVSAFVTFSLNSQDLLKLYQAMRGQSALQEAGMAQDFLATQLDLADTKLDIAKKEAEMYKWEAIGACIGMAIGVVGAAAGAGVGKVFGGGSLLGGFGKGIAPAMQFGTSGGQIVTNLMKAHLTVEKGELEKTASLAETAAKMIWDAKESNSQAQQEYNQTANELRQAVESNSRETKHNLGSFRPA